MSGRVFDSRTADKFVLRMPEGMRGLITQVAHDNHRSMNSEIVKRLEASLAEGALPKPEDVSVEGLSAQEHSLLKAIRAMSSAKRQALVEFIK